MRYFKHKKIKQFLFIDDSKPFWFEAINFNLVANKIRSDFEESKNDSKKEITQKLTTYIAKQEKRNFEELEISKNVKDKVAFFCKKIELDKLYYFHLEDNKPLLNQKLGVLKLEKNQFGSEEFKLFKFQAEDYNYDPGALPTVQNLLDGHISMDNQKLDEQEVLENLKMTLYMYFLMGFEVIEEKEIYSKVAGSINLEQEYDSPIYLYKDSLLNKDNYLNVNFFEKDLLVITRSYKVENKKIIALDTTPSFYDSKETFELIKHNTNEFYKGEKFTEVELSKSDFLNKYPIVIPPPIYFNPPEKSEFNPPSITLEIPQGIIDFDVIDFPATLVNINSLYFYIHEEGDNPLEWKAAFMVAKNLQKDIYIATKVFTLKDFNKVYEKTQEEELKYSDELKDFFKKKAKAYKKANLKPYSSEKVFEILSRKNISELKQQTPLTICSSEGAYFKQVITLYENYADVWITGGEKRHYLQFFSNSKERENWLKKLNTNDSINLYPKEKEHIEAYLNQIKNNEESFAIKQDILKEEVYSIEIFDSNYTRKKFYKTNFEVIEGDWVVEGDLVLARNTSLLLKGDLKVTGTLYFTNAKTSVLFDRPFIIIEGSVTAKNLVLYGGFESLQINKDFKIEEITANGYSKKQKNFYVGGQASTDILIHYHKDAITLNSCFEYVKEVNPFSDAILEKSIFSKDSYDSMKIEFQTIFDFLVEGKKILTDNIEDAKVDLDEYYKFQFEKRMKDWGYFYPEYAGCEHLSIYEDNQIKGNTIYPGSGDWVVHDTRGKSGSYGVSHEDYSIYSLKVKEPKNFNIDYKQKPLKLMVNAEELMKRYINISMLYMDWAHRKTVGFTEEKLPDTYEQEKEVFKEDPHLALYWLNHFGATLDTRYYEVVQLVEEYKLVEQLDIIKEPLAFFKKTNAFYNLEIGKSDKNEFKDLFLIRRAYLVYWEHTYKNYDPDNLDLWWKSVTIYPKIEENLIVRMRWLKNNLKKCENWSAFDKLIKEEHKNIPLLSYIFACNPNTSAKNKTKYADILITELIKHKNHFKTPHKKQFGEIYLWDVRDFVSDKEKLKEAATFYFQGNEISKEYQDIQATLGEVNENIGEITSVLEKLSKAFKGYDRFDTPAEEKQKYHQKIVTILDTLKPDIVVKVAQNIQNHELAKRYFAYLWRANIPNKKEALIRLFIHIELSGHNISPEIFGEDFSKLIKGDDDPNLDIAKALITIPEADFRNDYMWQNSKQAATKFFLTASHQPKIFKYLIETVKQAPTAENKHILDAIYTTLFSTEYDSNINPVLKFSKEQVETMLSTICNWFLEFGYHAEGYRSIYYCANPLAEEWITKHMNDTKWLKQFASISTFYDPLNEELKDAFVSALEFIEAEKNNTYLEFKDDKSHKFWEIQFYGDAFIVTYGKVGAKGRESEKNFDSDESCIKEGKKLIAQKIKKGYVKKIKS